MKHVAEPILLVAHADKPALIGIEKHVTLDYVEATPNYDPEAADTCFKKITIER